jgi:hypothetical protein
MWLEATKQNAGIFTMVRSNLRKFRIFTMVRSNLKQNSGFLPWLEAMKKKFRNFYHG